MMLDKGIYAQANEHQAGENRRQTLRDRDIAFAQKYTRHRDNKGHSGNNTNDEIDLRHSIVEAHADAHDECIDWCCDA